MGKLIRLSAAVRESPSLNSERKFPFVFLDGLIADLLPWVACGGHGTVSGIPNFAPLATMRLWNFCNNSSPTEAETKEAKRIEAILARADIAAVPAGIRGMSKFFSCWCLTRADFHVSRIRFKRDEGLWDCAKKAAASSERSGRRVLHASFAGIV